MNVVQLIYHSKAAPGIGARDVKQILRECHKNNVRFGVTGALCFREGRFFQMLEGSREAVLGRYEVIRDDRRHAKVNLVQMKETEKKLFQNWSMLYAGDDAIEHVLSDSEVAKDTKIDRLEEEQFEEIFVYIRKNVLDSGDMASSANTNQSESEQTDESQASDDGTYLEITEDTDGAGKTQKS